jgi:hypothetical protein
MVSVMNGSPFVAHVSRGVRAEFAHAENRWWLGNEMAAVYRSSWLDEPCEVDGSYREEVDGSYREEVDGSYREEVDGSYREEVDGSYRETVPGDISVTRSTSASGHLGIGNSG